MKKTRMILTVALLTALVLSASALFTACNSNSKDKATQEQTGSAHNSQDGTSEGGGSIDTGLISKDKAREIAYEDAQVTEEDVKYYRIDSDTDDGVVIYDVDFYTATTEYDYDINAKTGEILDKEVTEIDEDDQTPDDTTGSDATDGIVSDLISLKKAKEIALDDAKLSEKDVKFTKAELDNEDGIPVYEVDFETSEKEYEYDINALTGEITDKSVEKNDNDDDEQESADADTSELIGVEKAKEIALKDAGVSAKNATFTKAKLDHDDGKQVYEIEFYTSSKEYEYEINAVTGKIIDKSSERIDDDDQSSEQPEENTITLKEAKSIALKDAGVSEKDATFTKTKLEWDDGKLVYELEFYTSTTEYEYEINAETGKIIDKSEESIENGGSGSSEQPDGELITLEEAKSIALKDAGVSKSNATFTKAKLDTDDGVKVYDIEFYTSSKEYEYEINAKTGKIIEKNVEKLETDDDTPSSDDRISLDKAKEIAAAHAGYKVSEVKFTKAKLENDDGKYVYELEFYADDKEYEYEIDANTGNILDWDSEKTDHHDD